MSTKVYNKIVRTKIPKIIEQNGKTSRVIEHKLESKGAKSLLKQKVLEEAKEVFDSRSEDNLLEEMADLYEALDALKIAHFGLISADEMIKTVRESKNITRGSFIDKNKYIVYELKEVNDKEKKE